MEPEIRELEWHAINTLNERYCVIDVRSPHEFDLGHFPGAVCLPILSNEERAEIGTLYKQQGRDIAIRKGLKLLGPQMPNKIEALHKLKPMHTKIIMLYCWRGGLRSAIMAWLFSVCGYAVYRIKGGYKQFRQQVLQVLELPRPYRVLAGFTGSGKTALLQYMKTCGAFIIDLEDLAQHKGSAFGNLNYLPQPTQQQFENELAIQLSAYDTMFNSLNQNELPYIWLESESQRIGSINLPQIFFNNMVSAPLVNWIRPFDVRLNRIISEYGSFTQLQLEQAVRRMSKRLGGLDTQRVITYLNQSNIHAAFSILLNYYDRWYLKSRRADMDNKRMVWVYESSEMQFSVIYKSIKLLVNDRF